MQFALPKATDVRVTLSDLMGRVLQVHTPGRLGAGMQRLPLDLTGLARGVYLCRVEAWSLSLSKGQAERGAQAVVLRLAVQ